eukprot:jgi/Bigna1/81161/fgenesh1_pg.78_\
MAFKRVTTFFFSVPTRVTRKYEYKSILLNVCIFILVMEMCERLCFYGLTGSIKVLFQSRFGYNSFQAGALTNVLPSFVYITPLIGGCVADELMGRFKTIAIFGIIYLVAVSMMSYSVYPGQESKTLFMFSCFGLLSLGSGGIKANVVTLGGDQFDDRNPAHVPQKEQFFNYFYWSINIGAGVSYGYLAQMATNGSGDIPAEYGFFWSFTICAIALALALITFLGASGRYILHPPRGGTTGIFMDVFKASLRTSKKAWGVLFGAIFMFVGFTLSVAAAFEEDTEINKDLAITGCTCAESKAGQLDGASPRGSYGNDDGSAVASAKELWRVMPAVLCSTSFWVAYNQMSSNFYAQSCQMDLEVGGAQLNAAILNIGDCIAIVICIPLFDNFLYPFVERVKGSKFTLLQKMACGFIVATCALLSAAFIEIERRKSGVMPFRSASQSYSNCAPPVEGGENNPDTCDQDSNGFMGKQTCMSNMSVFWMAIPYFLIGVSECLISVQVYELCYTEIPIEMRSSAQAVNLFTTGLASAIAAGLTVAFQNYIPNDLNQGHLEYPYFTIAGLLLMTFFIFIYVTRDFEYKQVTKAGYDGDELDDVESDPVLDGKVASEKRMSISESNMMARIRTASQ